MALRIPIRIRIILAFLFIIIMVLSNQLFVPHFNLLGLIFIQGTLAFFITILFIALIVGSMPAIIKKHRLGFYTLTVIHSILIINSFINIMASIFFREDVAGFITRVYASPEYFPGFLINQALLFGVSIVTLKMIINNRGWFRGLKK